MKHVATRLLVLGLALTSLLLAGCGSTVSARCATVLAPDGSGTRTLTFVVAKSDTKDQDVSMSAMPGKLKGSKPPFATFTDQSNRSTYKYVISYAFKNPAEFEERARWFGATPSLSRQGAVLTPTLQLTETFRPETWFQWAIKATGRSSSDIKDVEYRVTMPARVQVDKGDGTTSGAEFSQTGMSFSGDYEIGLLSKIEASVDSLAMATTVNPDDSADRTLALSLPTDTVARLEKVYGGAGGFKQALESWAGEGWVVDLGSPSATGSVVSITKQSPSLAGLGIGDSGGDVAPTLDVLSQSNAYVIRRRYEERFSPAALIPGETDPGRVAYRLVLPWAVESFSPEGALRHDADGALSWSGAESYGFDARIDVVEVKRNVLYPVLGVAGLLTVVSLAGVAIGLARSLSGRARIAGESFIEQKVALPRTDAVVVGDDREGTAPPD